MKDYCISFIPITEYGVADILHIEQIFCKLTKNKAEKLKAMFEVINSSNMTKIKLLIEEFYSDDKIEGHNPYIV